jgi:hypothetical protein
MLAADECHTLRHGPYSSTWGVFLISMHQEDSDGRGNRVPCLPAAYFRCVEPLLLRSIRSRSGGPYLRSSTFDQPAMTHESTRPPATRRAAIRCVATSFRISRRQIGFMAREFASAQT